MSDSLTLTANQKRALDYSKHLSVTANAGSGKTFILTKRFINIILNENISLNEIAAITFTEKAASELYNKIASALDEVLQKNSSQSTLKKIESLRRQLVSANISTIHAFCASLLRQYPVEAAIDAAFSPIDANTSNELIDLSIEEVIQSELENSKTSVTAKKLIRLFGSVRIFSSQLKNLFGKRNKIIFLADGLYKDEPDKIVEKLYQSYLQQLNKILEPSIPTFVEAFNSIFEITSMRGEKKEQLIILHSQLNKELTSIGFLQLIKNNLLLLFTKENSVRKEFLSAANSDRFTKEIFILERMAEIVGLIEPWNNVSQTDVEACRTEKEILQYFEKVLDVYEKKKYDSGMLDYEDLLIKTSQLLANEIVRKDLSHRFKYLMIDEYQDTNMIQYEIFIPILDELRAGNLFVVGDEKQSIYRFREAELEVFSKTKEMIEKNENKEAIVTLPESFRMSPEICGFNNKIFSKLFEIPNDLFNEVSHSELICAKNDKGESEIEFLISDEEGEQSFSELIANKILHLHNEKEISYNSIAILSPKRKHFIQIEKELLKKNIPYAIVGGIGFYQVPLVMDIYNLFSFFLNNKNDIALIGILRSPFFFLSDNEIYSISLQPGETFWGKLKNASVENERARFAFSLLYDFSEKINAEDPISVLRAITSKTNFLSVYSARHDGTLNLSNFEKFISISRNFFEQGSKTLYDYVEFLKDGIEKEIDEGQAAVLDSDETVKIMTIHQAKGLQFQNIFIAASNESLRLESVKAKSVAVDLDFGILTKIPDENDLFKPYSSSPILSLFNFIDKQKAIAEYKRLFYVAATRPEDRLYICGKIKNDPQKNSFLRFLSDALSIDFKNEDKFILQQKVEVRNNISGKNDTLNLNLEIPITKTLCEPKITDPPIQHIPVFSMKLESNSDEQEEEIISATKVAIFNECPTKYFLTYEVGYSPLLEFTSRKIIDNDAIIDLENTIDNSGSETPRKTKISAALRGEIIHKLLELEMKLNEIDGWLPSQTEIYNLGEIDFNNFSTGLKEILHIFYSSQIFKEIIKYENCKKEFQIYLKEKDYYLFGIIDRIIIDEDSIWLIDYKTDKLKKSEIQKKQSRYFTQLKFYALLAAKYFPNVKTIRASIIFLEFPDHAVEFTTTQTEALNFSDEVFQVVNAVRKNNFTKKLEHCKDCFFSNDKNRCILV